jgi:RND superfamily putative drug exporter
LRAVPAPGPRYVGGQQAEFVDMAHAIRARLPLALGIIAVVTFVLLFFMVGSIVVPIKALFMNLLSLTASFGALVFIFQDGHFSGALDFTPAGTLYPPIPVLTFCIAFGLSMDYEMFLLSRIREEYDRCGSTKTAVSEGLAKTGRLVTASALIMSVVFISFATGGTVVLKVLGIGLGLAILADAFLIRSALLPATMELLGRANWWAPKPLRKLYARWGISEEVAEGAAAPATTEPVPQLAGARPPSLWS